MRFGNHCILFLFSYENKMILVIAFGLSTRCSYSSLCITTLFFVSIILVQACSVLVSHNILRQRVWGALYKKAMV